MNPIADYKLNAIRCLLDPELPSHVSTEDIRKALETLRSRQGVTIREAAEMYGVSVDVLKTRVCRAGIHPMVEGVKRSRRKASRYMLSDLMPYIQ